MGSITTGESVSKLKIDLIEVLDGEGALREGSRRKFCYTKMLLKSVLQLMGCKTRVAHKVRSLFMNFCTSRAFSTLNFNFHDSSRLEPSSYYPSMYDYMHSQVLSFQNVRLGSLSPQSKCRQPSWSSNSSVRMQKQRRPSSISWVAR